jgi:hypothetical protein
MITFRIDICALPGWCGAASVTAEWRLGASVRIFHHHHHVQKGGG